MCGKGLIKRDELYLLYFPKEKTVFRFVLL